MTQPVTTNQRFNRNNVCPICYGWPGSNPGCKGYVSDNPEYVYCTSASAAGGLSRMGEGQYRHKMSGSCNCGTTHGSVINLNTKAANMKQPEVKKTFEETFDYGGGCYVERFAVDAVKNGKQVKAHYQYQLIEGEKVYKGFKRLYRLDEVKAADPKEPVFIAEGERKVNKLWEMGYVATCNVGGSGGWQDSYSTELLGRKVLIWPDNDAPGAKFAEEVSRSLSAHGIKHFILNKLTVGLPDTGDVLDWVKLPGNDTDKLNKVIKEYLPDKKKLLWKLSELREYPKPTWLIEGVIKKNSLAFLVGPPKCGKSFYALMLALIVASMDGKVIYIGAEDPGDNYQRGLAWCEYNHVDPSCIDDNIMFWVEPIQLHDDEKRQEFLELVENEFNPDLIVVDTLAMNSMGLDENSQKDMGLFIYALAQLRIETLACILTVHHTNRAGQYRGSSVLPGSADTFILAQQEGDKLWKGGQLKIVFELQKNSKPVEDKYYRAEYIHDTLILVDTNTINSKFTPKFLNDTEKEILKACNSTEAEGGISVPAIVRLLGWGKDEEAKRTGAYKLCKDLADENFLVCIKSSTRVLYQITPKGRDIIQTSEFGF
jgi:5S rRNA maturation endonuclease (ribonuclease M5)